MNQRRAELLHRKLQGTLTEADGIELDALQKGVRTALDEGPNIPQGNAEALKKLSSLVRATIGKMLRDWMLTSEHGAAWDRDQQFDRLRVAWLDFDDKMRLQLIYTPEEIRATVFLKREPRGEDPQAGCDAGGVGTAQETEGVPEPQQAPCGEKESTETTNTQTDGTVSIHESSD